MRLGPRVFAAGWGWHRLHLARSRTFENVICFVQRSGQDAGRLLQLRQAGSERPELSCGLELAAFEVVNVETTRAGRSTPL